MNSKRGIIGGIVMLFVSTVVIVTLLLIFLFVSGAVKTFQNTNLEISFERQNDLGLTFLFGEGILPDGASSGEKGAYYTFATVQQMSVEDLAGNSAQLLLQEVLHGEYG